MITLIGDRVAKFLQRNNIEPHQTTTQVNLANGTQAKIRHVFSFECEITSQTHLLRALYLEKLTTSIVLGMDMLTTLGLSDTIENSTIPGKQNISAGVRKELHTSSISTLSLQEETALQMFLDTELKKFKGMPGRTTLVEHKIILKDPTPIKQRYYPRNPAMQKIQDEEVHKMLADDIIEKSSSPWSSPVVLIKKPSGKYSFCIDFRKVNTVSGKDAYPIPHINFILEKLREANYISTLDLLSGCWQIPMEKESRPITAFTIPGRGLYHFKVMPFGLHSDPAKFQRLLDSIIGPEFEPRAFAYLDDLVLISQTFEEHLQLLKEVFDKLRGAGLVINPEKCHFCKKELKYLGHIINEKGIHTDPEKVRAIKEFPTPKTVKQVRSFIGLASWYRRFVPNFALLTARLTLLTKKDQRWTWGLEQENAFHAMQDALTSAPILTCPDFNSMFTIQVDASNEGLGASLTQLQGKAEVVIAYASRLLSDSEKSFSTTEKNVSRSYGLL